MLEYISIIYFSILFTCILILFLSYLKKEIVKEIQKIKKGNQIGHQLTVEDYLLKIKKSRGSI